MKKEFISAELIRNNAVKVAQRIHQDGFIPDVIYVSLRGGAALGNVISEYFKLVRREGGRPVYYAAVVARSYTDNKERKQIMIDGWTYDPKYLRTGDKVLLADDIFDSGNTINYLVNTIGKVIPLEDIRIVVHDYKIRLYERHNAHHIVPDYYCRKLVLKSPDDDCWIHYNSHELVGLTSEEISHDVLIDGEVSTILKSIIPS